jgi:hypothetical protein
MGPNKNFNDQGIVATAEIVANSEILKPFFSR